MNGILNWFSGFTHSPGMLLAGLAAVSIPIIIHLLNKRKFKLVDWAAMDFLLEADKKNRRRIKLENLILLLLRCAAVALIGALIAQPFLSTGATAGLLNSQRYERIVVMDDSASMQTMRESGPAWDTARASLVRFLRELVDESGDNSLSLYLTSQPKQPIFRGRHIDRDSIDDIAQTIERLPASDMGSGLSETLDMLAKELESVKASGQQDVNHVVYLVSDMRSSDWPSSGGGENRPAERLKRVATLANGCYLIDAGEGDSANLAIVSIVPREKALGAGLDATFDIAVTNFSEKDIPEVSVEFPVGLSGSSRQQIRNLKAGDTKVLPFNYSFAAPPQGTDANNLRTHSLPMLAELTVPEAALDQLPVDNFRQFAARVGQGIRTLVVDGNSAAESRKSEAFFLAPALGIGSESATIVSGKVINLTEFETARLGDFDVIFLCNVSQISNTRREALEQWTMQGGGLVMLLGDSVESSEFNTAFFRDGKGLSPARLVQVRSAEPVGSPVSLDESASGIKHWNVLKVESPNHGVLQVLQLNDRSQLDDVKVSRWWETEVPAETLKENKVSVLARFTQPEGPGSGGTAAGNVPALVEQVFGSGRVMLITTSADPMFSNWAGDISYILLMQELTRYMTRGTVTEGDVPPGLPIRYGIDLKRYRSEVTVQHRRPATRPEPEKLEDRPVLDDDDADRKGSDKTLVPIKFEETQTSGFYKLQVSRTDGTPDAVIYGVNPASTESNLQRADLTSVRDQLRDAPVQVLLGKDASFPAGGGGADVELWRGILILLLLVLGTEQFLGWMFGKRRQ